MHDELTNILDMLDARFEAIFDAMIRRHQEELNRCAWTPMYRPGTFAELIKQHNADIDRVTRAHLDRLNRCYDQFETRRG